jgi:bifunctional non-homologous end joining protein LigD
MPGGKTGRPGRPDPDTRIGRAAGECFVVHEHKASRLHYDFRLELAGVLKPWAIPKGPSLNPADRRLAVMVPDHPVDHIGFEGIILSGQYGAGPVVVWDRGTYRVEDGGSPRGHLRAGKLAFVLKGKKLKGRFALARLRSGKTGRNGSSWKKGDADADRSWKLRTELTPARLARLAERTPPCETA